jgi:hypothetical protein
VRGDRNKRLQKLRSDIPIGATITNSEGDLTEAESKTLKKK